MITITAEPLDLNALITAVSAPHCGAVASFLGVVRNHNQGRDVLFLEYECYAPMVIQEMERIIAEAQSQWPIHAIAVAHRTGKLLIGEASVAIAVSSAHRHAGLEALRYTIDELKKRAPIWKKETWSDGSSWIEQCGH